MFDAEVPSLPALDDEEVISISFLSSLCNHNCNHNYNFKFVNSINQHEKIYILGSKNTETNKTYAKLWKNSKEKWKWKWKCKISNTSQYLKYLPYFKQLDLIIFLSFSSLSFLFFSSPFFNQLRLKQLLRNSMRKILMKKLNVDREISRFVEKKITNILDTQIFELKISSTRKLTCMNQKRSLKKGETKTFHFSFIFSFLLQIHNSKTKKLSCYLFFNIKNV